ncbi:unnamed protein product [Ceratitis capitata]|uniref:(Mediterranean fruit fly) hypothetical protein n=1 Tax=Ceratitis capitata TaxID=7213 RepID=A0A811VGT9_CERCA|nr:unnamed protein product [Ceratitis capitata]
MSSTKSRRASSAVTGRASEASSSSSISKAGARLRSNSTAPTAAGQKSAGGVMGGLRKMPFLRRKTVDHLRSSQPLMEEGGAGGGVDGCGVAEETNSWNCHRKNAAENSTTTTTTTMETTMATTTTTANTLATASAATAITTSSYYSNNSNNRHSSSGSYSIEGSLDGNVLAGGTVLVTTTAVHATPTTYNNNLHLDGNKIADDAL